MPNKRRRARYWFALHSCACSLLALAALQRASSAYSQTADSFTPGANGPVYTVALQRDGNIILGGSFTLLGGQTRNILGRVDVNGTLDLNFNPAPDGEVDCLAVQPDGKILVGGYFRNLAGAGQRFLGRLEASGALDSTFSPNLNGPVLCIAFQPDGKLVVGGSFSMLNGQPRNNIARLNPDGTTDTTFNGAANNGVSGLAVQPDGKIVISGYFTAVNGQTNNRISRLNPDGTTDPAFNASADNTVRSVTLQADGRILLLGDFASLNGHSQFYVGRLNADGTLDASFAPNANSNDESLVLQADGRIVLGGPFTALNGQPCNRLGRLNGDGSFDQSFNPGADAMVMAVALQPDGKVLAGGIFTNLASQVRGYIGRVNNTDPASQSLTFDGATVTWQRGGTSPELLWVTFDACTNGSTWFGLTPGQRVPGGWQGTLSGTPATATVRANGLVAAAHANSARSTWFIESSIGPPAVSTQPFSRTNNAGDLATISVLAAGDGVISYQWFKDGVLLNDSFHIYGSQSPVLTLSNILAADGGAYSVVITNGSYAVTSQVATLTVIDPCITSQPANQAAAAGQSASFTVTATGTPNLFYQWRKAGVSISGATGTALNLTNVQSSDATTYDVVVTNGIGSVTSSVCNLTVNQVTADSLNPGADNYISTIAVQPDRKVLLGGMFLNLAGGPHSALGRLNADGTVDASFTANATAQYFPQVNCFAIQSNGLIIVGGYFTGFNGQPRTNLARLKPNGTLDAAFNLSANSEVMCLAAQPDGQLLVGGYFTNVAGHLHTCLARISAGGVVDDTFSPTITTDSNAGVNAMAVQPDGKILLGGWFTNLCGQSRRSLGRLNPDGTLDPGFTANAIGGDVYCITLQADGKILVGGQFTSLAGQPRNGFGRLYPDGTLDAGFAPPINSYGVFALAMQADGKILVGGGFTNITGLTGNCLERLNSDGSYDTLFNPQPDNWVYSIAVQEDGRILVGGSFQNVAGQARSRIARLSNTDLAIQSLTCDGASITWMRSGTCPEPEMVRFDVSTNGNDLFSPGTPVHIPGAWQLTGLSFPTNVSVRARAFFGNNSSWYSEATAGAPFLSLQPSTLSTNVYATVLFSVAGGGAPPLSYLWLKGGVPLTNNAHISGANTANLTVNNVLGADAGAYTLVLSNQFGSITSVVASLTVQDPMIGIQPVSQIGNLGLTSVFNVSVAGTAPFGYGWRKAGSPIAGGTTSSLTIQHVQIADGGNYDVIVTNAFGSTTSTVATLTVNTVLADGFNSVANSTVYCLVPQPDGKVLAGGTFSWLAGQLRSCLGRLTSSGALDTTFHPAVGGGGFGSSASVNCLFIQEDGRILVGGNFTNLAGQACTNLGRVNFDGSADSTFRPQPNFPVNAVAVQADGKLVVGGKFTTIAGQPRLLLARLYSDGSIDPTFNPGASGGFTTISALAVQTDGKIIVGGDFTTLGGVSRPYLGRLNSSGSFDFTFSATPNAPVTCVALQPDGKILVGGAFSNLNSQVRRYLARVNTNGTLDTSFNPSASNSINCFALQADGKILVGGNFTNLAGQMHTCIGRLNPDGTPDLAFEPQATGAVSAPSVSSLALQSDGNVLVGGTFATIAGMSRNNIARLLNTDRATNTLSFDGANITWLRGETSPEVLRTTFEWSSNGTNWSSLGFATRTTVGWQLTNTALPADTALRAAGLVSSGRGDASTYYVETTRPALAASALTQGQFGFNVIGSPGQGIIIEGSFDLQTWTPLSTNTLGFGPLGFADQISPVFPARFYRARQP